jgi:hypothetical protein
MSRRRRKASEEIEREEIPIGIGRLWAGVEAIDKCRDSRLTVHPGIGLKREKGESKKRGEWWKRKTKTRRGGDEKWREKRKTRERESRPVTGHHHAKKEI